MTALFVFCAARIPPSGVAIIPSALLPVPVQMDFHLCPAAMTPGIALTVYSRCSGGPAAAAAVLPPLAAPAAAAPAAPCAGAAPRPAPPPRGGGGVLHFVITHSGYL